MEKFDPKPYIIALKGKDYLPVAARLIWFRHDHPDWSIITTPVEINMVDKFAIFTASILNAEGKIMATAHKMETVKDFGDFLEKAETGSMGRALAACGFGTQFCTVDFDEMQNADNPRPADAPFNRPPGTQRQGQGQGQGNPPQRPTTPVQQPATQEQASGMTEKPPLEIARIRYAKALKAQGYQTLNTLNKIDFFKVEALFKQFTGKNANTATIEEWEVAATAIPPFKPAPDVPSDPPSAFAGVFKNTYPVPDVPSADELASRSSIRPFTPTEDDTIAGFVDPFA